MLTVEETGWSLNAFRIFSFLNILPIGVDVKSGKIQKQSNRVKVFIWKLLFGIVILHWFYMLGRLVQSTILEPQKYFRWDHFVLHFGFSFAYAALYLTGFLLFVKHPAENVIVFNQLFLEREDPAQKMMDQQLDMQTESGVGNFKINGNVNKAVVNSASGNKARGKSGAQLVSTSTEAIEMEVLENQYESKSEDGPRPRPLLTWPPQYSLDELMAKLFAWICVFTALFTLLIFSIDPTRPQLLYSVLPPDWQNVWSFCILLAVEALCLAIVYFTSSFSLVTQVLFFSKCQLEFKRMSLQLRNLEKKQNPYLGFGGQEIGREIGKLRQILKEMRELVVFIELFNRCCPFCIFLWKIFSLSVCILYYFFVIRHSHDVPFLGLFLGYIAIAITVTYTIVYANAFSIPGKMDQLKNEFLLIAQKTVSKSNESKKLWAEMKREIKRIHGVGVKVGSFNQMERESTPNFIDFVLRNVVTLLVTFSR